MSGHDDSLESLLEQYAERRIDRRQFFQHAGAIGLSMSAASAILAPVASAAGRAAAGKQITRGGTFIEGYDRDFTKMDTIVSGWADPGYYALYEFTMTRDPKGRIVPAMAESWQVRRRRPDVDPSHPQGAQVPVRRSLHERGGRRQLQHHAGREDRAERDLLAADDHHRRPQQHRRHPAEEAGCGAARDTRHRVLDDREPRDAQEARPEVRRHRRRRHGPLHAGRVHARQDRARRPLGGVSRHEDPVPAEQGDRVRRRGALGADRRAGEPRQRDRERHGARGQEPRAARTSAGSRATATSSSRSGRRSPTRS